MTIEPPWPAEFTDPGAEPPRRYQPGVVVGVALATALGAPGVTFLASLLASSLTMYLPFLPILPVLIILAVPVMIIVSSIATHRSTAPRSRSVWMGVLIGCGLALIVGAGLCVAVITSLNSG
ncbi:unannotated protein [freshwater metagenome]|uniref:Unannotated protein n=1 Tax=freshwater metagenome TaxID=449393 RepID=A0A6J7RD66_9ZZZZ|nr:hypothetical protein [Actinomycetota bacterium]MSW37274.1 hypothetical protein [Actinomycetota bacterium]MSX39164.1 hypothetical protein [Actinomycetota bacterium]